MYDSVEQANLRLGNSVVVFDGHLRYCERAQGAHPDIRDVDGNAFAMNDIILRFFKMTPNARRREGEQRYDYVKLSDERLQYTKLRSGYFNTPDGPANLLIRRPNRCYKQGLHRDNSFTTSITSTDARRLGRGDISHYTLSDGVSDMTATSKMVYDGLYRGQYPSLNEGIERLKDAARRMRDDRSGVSVAISRSMCMMYEPELEVIYVMCRGELIGMYMKSSGLMIPKPKSFYREEAATLFPKVTIQSEAA